MNHSLAIFFLVFFPDRLAVVFVFPDRIIVLFLIVHFVRFLVLFLAIGRPPKLGGIPHSLYKFVVGNMLTRLVRESSMAISQYSAIVHMYPSVQFIVGTENTYLNQETHRTVLPGLPWYRKVIVHLSN
jgi:hypothetical protein